MTADPDFFLLRMMEANHNATLRSALMVASDAKQTQSKAANQDNKRWDESNQLGRCRLV